MTPLRSYLSALLVHHEAVATSVRELLGLLDGPLPRPAARPHRRRAAAAVPPKRKQLSVHERRTRSAAWLAQFSETPRPLPAESQSFVGALLRRGYIKKTPRGYVRTAKPFIVKD